MRERHLDRLFDRFRRRGDVRALADVFDGTAPELYRVAAHLTKDLHEAEDLVQATFLAAIEARDTYDDSRRLLPWLLGILTRKASLERRRRLRSIDPERLRTPLVPQPAEEVVALELSAELDRALETLPDLYREVLAAHLRHGKSTNEIALEFGRAPGTVRVQLHRGLELLRKSLPGGLAMGGAVAFAPRGLSAVREVILSSARAAVVPAAAGAVVATGFLGGAAMGTKVWIVAGGALLGLAYLGWRSNESIEAPGSAIEAQPETARDFAPPAPVATAAPDVASLETTSERAPVQRPSEPPASKFASVSGSLSLPDGTPAAGVPVALVRNLEGRPGATVIDTTTTSGGAFELRADPSSYFVVGLAKGLLPLVAEVSLPPETRLVLERGVFSAGAHIRGTVRILGVPATAGCEVNARVRAEGREVGLGEQSLVWSSDFRSGGAPEAWSSERLLVPGRQTKTDAEGRFALEGLAPRLHGVSVDSVSEVRVLRAGKEVLAPAEGVVLDVDFARLVLRVECEEGPLDAQVFLREHGALWWLDAHPVAELLVPPRTAYGVRVEREGYSTAKLELVAPGSGETLERVVSLTKKTDLAALVVDVFASGERIQKAGFAFFDARGAPRDPLIFSRAGPGGRQPSLVRDASATDGSFRLQALPPGIYDLGVRAGGTWDGSAGYWYHDPVQVELIANEEEYRRVDLLLGGRIAIQCSNRSGAPLDANCELQDRWGTAIPVAFFTRDEQGSTWLGGPSLNASAPQGRNELASNLPPGRYEVRLTLDGYVDEARSVIVEAGKTAELSVVLTAR
jgi:RNA polymerase sigma factor (sigma-70 family)